MRTFMTCHHMVSLGTISKASQKRTTLIPLVPPLFSSPSSAPPRPRPYFLPSSSTLILPDARELRGHEYLYGFLTLNFIPCIPQPKCLESHYIILNFILWHSVPITVCYTYFCTHNSNKKYSVYFRVSSWHCYTPTPARTTPCICQKFNWLRLPAIQCAQNSSRLHGTMNLQSR